MEITRLSGALEREKSMFNDQQKNLTKTQKDINEMNSAIQEL